MLTYHLFRFFSRLLKTVYGFFPTTYVNLSTCSDATFENSLRTLPNNGRCSIAYSIPRRSENSSRVLQVTDVNLSLVQTLLNILKTVYGFSSNGCQSIACSDATFWKQLTDASQQRMLLYCLFKLQDFWKQFTGSPVTDVNLSLVQILLKTSENSLWILPNNGC